MVLLETLAASADDDVAAPDDPYAMLRPTFFLEPGTYATITRFVRV